MNKSPSAHSPNPDNSKPDEKAKEPVKPQVGMLFVIDDDHSGRDEMNLAGNPFALLYASGKAKSGESHIKYEWKRRLQSGKTVDASWEVNGHAKLGLPGPSDEMLYLVLLQMTREAAVDGVWPQQVHFSRGTLLKRLGWGDGKKEYALLKDCFARLGAVTIQAHNAFYDAETKAPLAFTTFNILEADIIEEPRGRKGANSPLPLSSFSWHDKFYKSLVAGNVRSLALDFWNSLNLPTSRRLFRYLDLFRNSQKPPLHEFKIGLVKLRDHLGMVNIKYLSQVKQRLLPAHEELIERGYLENFQYRKGVNNTEMVIYTFADGVKRPDKALKSSEKAFDKAMTTTPQPVVPSMPEVVPPVALPSIDMTLKIALADDEYLNDAADVVLESLPLEEKDRIKALGYSQLSDFLKEGSQKNSAGFKLGLRRNIRMIVRGDYKTEVEAEVRRVVTKELAAFEANLEPQGDVLFDELVEVVDMEVGSEEKEFEDD